MSNKLFLILISFGCFFFSRAQSDINPHVVSPHVSPVLKLTENLGQWEPQVLFRAQLDGGALYLEKGGLTFNFYDKKKYRALHHGGILKKQYKDMDIAGHAYKISFENCNPEVRAEKAQQGPDYENFFIGNDKQKWKGGARNYHQVVLKDIYDGIDYEMLTAVSGLKYNFHIQANADPAQIKLRYQGVDKIRLKDGTLVLSLSINEVVEQKPYAYQLINGQVKEVKCLYQLKDKILGFSFPEGYDKSQPLVIDPVLVFAAQSGSTADNFGMTATYDTQGNLYSGGTVFDTGYPTTLGAYMTSFNGTPANGNTDVVITKYNSSGTALLFSTYFGGTGTEIVSSLIVDSNDNLCFYGATGSSNLPITSGAYDNSFNGGVFLSFYFNGTVFNQGTDIYVGKFNSSGTSLLASTYLGGSNNDGVNHVNHLSLIATNPNIYEYATDSLQRNYGDQYRGEIQLDASNNIYIVSSTRSSDFPTANAYDNSLGGKQDAIVAKFNPSLTQLTFCTFLGGSSNDCGNSIIVNGSNEAYVTGGTCSADFPVTAVANSTTYNGGKSDGYIVHLNTSGNTLLQSTFVGTNNYDQCYFIQTDKYDNIYVYGQSLGNMPIVNYVHNSITYVPYNNPGRHQFITRYNNVLSTKNMSTVFGNSTNGLDISPSAFAVDKCNNIYISGWGGDLIYQTYATTNMPLMLPTQSNTDGFDFYFMGLDSNAVNLKYGSYFGGSFSAEHVDGGTSRFDPGGRIYQSVCAGCGGNDDFPVTPNAWPNTPGNPNHAFNCNNGVIKLDFQLQLAIATISTNTLTGCSPLTVTLTNATPPQGSTATYTWDLGNGNTSSSNANPIVTYTNPGTYTVQLTVEDNLTCNKIDRTKTYITVLPKPAVTITLTGGACTTTIQATQTTTGNLSPNPYLWDFGNGNTSTLSAPGYTYPASGTYTVHLTVTDAGGCTDVETRTISILDFSPGAVNTASLCYGLSTNITASGGTSYTWFPASTLNNPFAASPVANPLVNTTYTVNIVNNSTGNNCQKTLTTQVLVYPTPTTAFSYSANPCGGDVRFFDQSADDIVKWNWSLATKTSTLQNPYIFYTNGGSYTITLESTNIYGCKDLSDTVITLLKPPPVSVSANTAICIGDQTQLHATGGISYQWTPPQTLDFPASADPIATPPVNTTYSVLVTTSEIVNNTNCKFLLVTDVQVDVLSSSQISAFANPVLINTGDNSTLTYVGDPGALVTWLPPGSTSPATGYTVTASPDRPTTYTATARRGACEEDVTVHVDAYTSGCIESDAFIPNTFTPNGDGENDVFRVKGLKVSEVYLTVYNRWGEKVFETNDLEKGWDGKYKGKPADVGVFGWYLKVKCLNGAETFKKGNVTLIR